MTSITLALAPLIALQSAGTAPVAIENDAPETWTLEYPRIIQPYVEDYRRCLTIRLRRVTGEADFEMQHRDDVAACDTESQEAQGAALAALGGQRESNLKTRRQPLRSGQRNKQAMKIGAVAETAVANPIDVALAVARF